MIPSLIYLISFESNKIKLINIFTIELFLNSFQYDIKTNRKNRLYSIVIFYLLLKELNFKISQKVFYNFFNWFMSSCVVCVQDINIKNNDDYITPLKN